MRKKKNSFCVGQIKLKCIIQIENWGYSWFGFGVVSYRRMQEKKEQFKIGGIPSCYYIPEWLSASEEEHLMSQVCCSSSSALATVHWPFWMQKTKRFINQKFNGKTWQGGVFRTGAVIHIQKVSRKIVEDHLFFSLKQLKISTRNDVRETTTLARVNCESTSKRVEFVRQ